MRVSEVLADEPNVLGICTDVR